MSTFKNVTVTSRTKLLSLKKEVERVKNKKKLKVDLFTFMNNSMSHGFLQQKRRDTHYPDSSFISRSITSVFHNDVTFKFWRKIYLSPYAAFFLDQFFCQLINCLNTQNTSTSASWKKKVYQSSTFILTESLYSFWFQNWEIFIGSLFLDM